MRNENNLRKSNQLNSYSTSNPNLKPSINQTEGLSQAMLSKDKNVSIKSNKFLSFINPDSKKTLLTVVILFMSLAILISCLIVGAYTQTEAFNSKNLKIKENKLQGISGQEIFVEISVKPFLIGYNLVSDDENIAYVRDNRLFAKNAGIVKVKVLTERGTIVDTLTIKVFDKNNRFDYNVDFNIEDDADIICKNEEDYKDQKVISGRNVLIVEAPYKIGYKFAGWYYDSSFSKKFSFDDKILNDIVLYPRWQVIDLEFGVNGYAVPLTNGIYKENYVSSVYDSAKGGSAGGAPNFIENKGNYSFSLSETNFEGNLNKLPQGISLDTLGNLTGIPLVTGTYNFVVKIKDNITLQIKEAEFAIFIEKQFVTLDFSQFDDVTYNGLSTDKKVLVKKEYSDISLNDNLSAVLAFDNTPLEAGDYTVTVNSLSGENSQNYKLPLTGIEKEFTIKQKIAEIAFTSDDDLDNKNFNLIFNGEERQLFATISNICENDSAEVFLTYNNIPIGVGNYTATVAYIGNENYVLNGEVTQNFTISAVEVDLNINRKQSKIYGNTDELLQFTLTPNRVIGEFMLGSIESFVISNLSRAEGENVGTYKYSIQEAPANSSIANNVSFNYTNIEEEKFTISPRELQIEGKITKLYDKNNTVNTDNLSLSNVVREDNVSFVGEYADVNVAKDITVTFTLTNNTKGNYCLRGEYKGIIEAKEVGLNFSELTEEAMIYDGSEKIITVSASNLINGDASDVSSEYQGDRQNVGNFTVKATSLSNENYRLPSLCEQEYEIVKKQITIKADNITKEYGVIKDNVGFEFGYTVVRGDIINQDVDAFNQGLQYQTDFDYTFKAKRGVGSYTITLSYTNNNYDITFENGNISITKASLSIIANPIEVFYGMTTDYILGEKINKSIQIPLYKYSDETLDDLNGDNLSYNTNYRYKTQANAQGILIYPQGLSSDNYNISYSSAEVTVKKKDITVAFNDYNLIYNGLEQEISATLNGVEYQDVVSINKQYNKTVKNVDDYSLTISITNDNYSLTGNVTQEFKISKKELNITVGNLNLTYGDDIPSISTLTYDGFVAEENENTVNIFTTKEFTTNYTIKTPADSDSIYIDATISAPNYEIIIEKGIITVKPKKITVTFDKSNYSFVYGTNILISVQANEVLSGDSVELVRKYSRANENLENTPTEVGEYDLAISITNTNYELTGVQNVTFTITQKEITVNTNSLNDLEYDGTEKELTFSIDDPSINGLIITADFNGKIIKDADYYTVNFTLNNGNYKIIKSQVNFSIAQKEVVLNFSELIDEAMIYDGSEKIITVSASELINGDASDVIFVYQGDRKNAGKFTVKATSLSNSNYRLPILCEKEYEIFARAITVSAKGTISKTYDGTTDVIFANGDSFDNYYQFSNVVIGDNLVLENYTLIYNNKDVLKAVEVYVIGFELNNSNYKLTSQTLIINGNITANND